MMMENQQKPVYYYLMCTLATARDTMFELVSCSRNAAGQVHKHLEAESREKLKSTNNAKQICFVVLKVVKVRR